MDNKNLKPITSIKRNVLALASIGGLILFGIVGFVVETMIAETTRDGVYVYSKFKSVPLFLGISTGPLIGVIIAKIALKIPGVFIVFTTLSGFYLGIYISIILLPTIYSKIGLMGYPGFLLLIVYSGYLLIPFIGAWLGAQITKKKVK